MTLESRRTVIVLVERDDDVRELLTALIERAAHRVRAVEDADAGYALLAADPDVDMLVIDDALAASGDLVGVELVRRAKTLRPRLKVLYTVGLARQLRDAVDATADAIGRTPHVIDKLIRAIRAILETSA